MAVSIVTEPSATDIVAAYIPDANRVVVDVTISTGELPPKLRSVVRFYEVGTATLLDTSATIDYEYSSDQGSNTYRFDIDLAGRVQAYFDNLTLFPTLNTYAGVNDKYGCDYVASFTELRSTGSNNTYQPGGSGNTSSITVVNAYRPLTQTQNMDEYDANLTASNNFFTNKPDGAQVDYSANEWLFVHDDDAKYFVNVQFYNPTLLGTRQFLITGTTIGANNTGKIGAIGVGPVNIDAVGAAGRFIVGSALPMETNNITHYKVRVQNSGATEITPERTYYVNNCPVKYRIHFVNQLGGVDTLLVDRSKEDGIKATRETYYTAKHAGNTAQVSGAHTLTAVGTDVVAFKKAGLTPDEFNWLKELAVSPAVMLESSGSYIPLVVTKVDFEPEDEIGQSFSMEFEAEYSNRIEGLRN